MRFNGIARELRAWPWEFNARNVETGKNAERDIKVTVNIDWDSYPPETPFRFWRLRAEDGSVFQYACPWWDEETMAKIEEPARSQWENARTQALWVGFEALFRGELPEYPKAVEIVAEFQGTRDNLPPWWGVLT
ncbi:hypothetical protein HWB90_gp082 [Mycobacterium phage Fowlmouth]|uniref:Uncharacterized protein n=1 Tax=Mycobacterium phage Fowlmouth TaxID=2419978 RepID=A0A3G2KGH0_9CAUD|nr:hypothetical protein HWB90_gp082 [Mycobacterium phage Fowlmouth]AYN58057.1 hypothetical protein SEA_FOWLMOUTH_108 [Mycobacterium phage Fowlmouth]